MQQLKLHNKTWAVGLWWQILDSRKTALADARNLAQSLLATEQYNCFALRLSGALQAGFGKCRGPIKSWPSLAGALANAEPGTWLGRFVLDGGVFVVAVSGGLILSDGDFFGSAEDAEAVFNGHLGTTEWSEIFDFSTTGESLQHLREMLKLAKTVPTVRPVRKTWSTANTIQLILFFAILAVGWHLWSTAKESERLAEEARRAEQQRLVQEQLAAATKVDQVQPSLPTWFQEPAVSSVLERCEIAFRKLQLIEAGWELTAWSCTKSETQRVYAHAVGTFETRPSGAIFDPKTPMTSLANSAFPDSLPADALRTSQSILDLSTASSRLFDVAKDSASRIRFDTATAEALVDGTEKAQWSLERHGLPPFDRALRQALNTIPGLVLQQVSWDLTTGVWTFGGDLYVKKSL